MNSQPYCHVRFTQMFIPSPLVWVVNSSGLLGQCSRGVLLIKMTCMAVRLFHPQEQVCRCTGFGCGVSGSAYNTGPPCFQGSDLPQMRSGKRLRSRLCCSGLVHKPTRRSYGRSVSVSLDPTSSGPCPRKKKGKKNSCKHMTSSHSFTDESCNSHYPTGKWTKLLPQWFQELMVDL